MQRRTSRARLWAGALTGLLAACSADAERPPNIVLLSIDTLRPDRLGCYGAEREVSPELDALADAGTLFEDVTAPSPWTLPSHASMLTGQYPVAHGVRTNERALTETTLASWLRVAGYQTIAVVNAHNVGHPTYRLLEGFESSVNLPEVEKPGGPILNRADEVLRRGVGLLNRCDAERPFFLFLHFYDVHTDLTPTAQWQRELVEPYDGPVTGRTRDLIGLRSRMLQGRYELSPADRRFLEQMYDAEIRSLDQRLAQFFDALDAAGLSESTLVCVTSDHGEEFGEHGGLLHGRTHYQELVRIPWILRGPGVPAGRRVAEPVHLVDVVPTLLALAGLPPLEGVDGEDVSVAWRGTGLSAQRLLFSEADHNNVIDGEVVHDFKRMVRQGDLVLHHDTRTGTKELYDLADDPAERRDLAGDRPEDVERLFAALESFAARASAPDGSAGDSAVDIGAVSEGTQELLEGLGYGGGE